MRAKIILSNHQNKTFTPFDRFAQFEASKGKNIDDLLHEFELLRSDNLKALAGMNIDQASLKLTGEHPDFGTVTLRQLLATWAVHDLNHIYQITRAMAKQYREDIGPWIKYLRLINES